MEVEVAHDPQIKAEPMDGDSDSEDEMDTITTASSRRAVVMQAVPAPVMPSAEDMRFLMNVSQEDLPHEEDVLRNPYSLKSWWRYLEFKSHSSMSVRKLIYERALKKLPGSYKLWFNYLTERRQHVKGKCITNPAYKSVNNAFERALVYMHKMPRIWLDYVAFLILQKKITDTRRTLDRALRALPITQHERLWKLCMPWVTTLGLPNTAKCLYRRYLEIEPDSIEDYVEYLISVGEVGEAVAQLASIVDNERFVSERGASRHELWVKLCELLANHPREATSVARLPVDAIIRQGISRFTHELARLWIALAQYYIRLANFQKARDIFEEAINSVMTVRDFSSIWDAYTRFEDSIIEAQMGTGDEEDEEDEVDFELRLARYEHLIAQRPLLLSSVLLRQNPHNVYEWHKRARLFLDDPAQAAKVFAEAVKTVDPKQATGKPHTLWVSYGRLYERHGDLDTARVIFRKATQVEFRSVDDLASVWCEFVEMELRALNYEGALALLREACVVPRARSARTGVLGRLFKSTKLWALHADLEESIGTFVSTKAVYDRILDLRIATPQIVLNFAVFLEEHNHFEDSFKAYEKGVSMFTYPHVFDLWVAYLTKFVERYQGTKIERTRDLFEQAVEKVPAKYAKALYLMYAHVEEQFGLARHAMNVYDRACRAVEDKDKPYLYSIYVARATEFFGVTRTREIFEQAISVLPEKLLKDISMQYAELERRLGEIDRARAVYVHASQFCDPSVYPDYWKTWHTFEVRHGNEDTFREMLRVKRSVQATFSTQVNMAAPGIAAALAEARPSPEEAPVHDQMARLEQLAQQATDKKAGLGAAPGVGGIAFTRATQEVKEEEAAEEEANPEEISLGDEDEEQPAGEEEEEEEGGKKKAKAKIEQKQVPSTLFGSLQQQGGKKEEEEEEEEKAKEKGTKQDEQAPLGALARLRMMKKGGK